MHINLLLRERPAEASTGPRARRRGEDGEGKIEDRLAEHLERGQASNTPRAPCSFTRHEAAVADAHIRAESGSKTSLSFSLFSSFPLCQHTGDMWSRELCSGSASTGLKYRGSFVVSRSRP